MAKRIRLGDVFEIPTSRGLAYAQYVHKRPEWGALIRVLPGFHSSRPPQVDRLVAEPARFVVFFPLQQAVSRKIFEVVANGPIPDEAKELPLFRARGFIDREGRVQDWWLWNGEREWKIGELSDEYRRLPIREVWNDTLLISRIEEDWTPAREKV